MSVRSIRRSFASPFIVTLASSAAVACSPKPISQDHVNPPGPHTNPPAPDTKPISEQPKPEPAENPPEKPPVVGTVNPPPPQPAREPAKFEQNWTVMKSKDQCLAMVDVGCPKPEAGKPTRTCNPPPPFKYACPDGFQDGDTMKIVLRAGATECMVKYDEVKCPPKATCNPPPPRKVPCPER